MKRASSALTVAQVQSVVLPSKVHEPRSPAEELEDATYRSIKCDPKLLHHPSPKSDENKIAKSPAMSRLLSVDSENYMLRKASGSGSGSTTSTSSSMSITTTSNIVTSQQRDCPRGFAISSSRLSAPGNGTYCTADISFVQVSAVTGNSNLPNNLEKSVSYESSQNGYDEANQSIRSPHDSSAHGNHIHRAVLAKGGATVAQRRTSNQSQIGFSNSTHNVSLSISSSASSSSTSNPFCPSFNPKQVSSGKVLENVFSEQKAQEEQPQLFGFQLQSDRLDLSTSESSAIDIDEHVGSCARPLSFHRHMCWCNSQVPVSKNSVADDQVTEVEIELSNNNNNNNSNNNNVKSNLPGNDPGFVVVNGEINGIDTNGIVDRVVNHVNSYRSLCCCMCGSLCPTECHACFHVVCSEFNGQHLCQWSSKGHALPGQVFDKEKVSVHDVRYLFLSLFFSSFSIFCVHSVIYLHFQAHTYFSMTSEK